LQVENQGMKNTYLEDFAFFEVMEPECGIIGKAINQINNAWQFYYIFPFLFLIK